MAPLIDNPGALSITGHGYQPEKFSLGGADPHRLNPWPKFRLRQEFGCSRPTADRMKATMPPWPCPALQQCLAQSSTSNQRQSPAATAFLGPFSPILVHIFKTCSVYCSSSGGLSFPMVIQQWLKPWENQLKRKLYKEKKSKLARLERNQS